MSAPSYMHAIDGRLRIKVPIIKGSSANAASVKAALEQLAGIRYVKANPTTGNVLALFDPEALRQERIIDMLIDMNCFGRNTLPYSASRPLFGGYVAETLVQSAVQIALERVILALV